VAAVEDRAEPGQPGWHGDHGGHTRMMVGEGHRIWRRWRRSGGDGPNIQ
jgi:hypothetical protein